ncbi:MAG: DUF3332 family protein [Bacteroidales bacterium]|nr:DUF3332 family protein [Bacteroidales bacterium]
MKKIKSLSLGLLFLAITLTQTGCFGSFKLTTGLYDWNMNIGGDGAKEVVFLAFLIVPVYGVTVFLDVILLNTIEYWSGDSPYSMNEGEEEIQIVKNNGNSYQITATKNKFSVVQLDGKNAGDEYQLVYHEDEASWYIEANGITKKFAHFNLENKSIDLIKPDGKIIEIDPSTTSKEAVKAAIHLDLAKID